MCVCMHTQGLYRFWGGKIQGLSMDFWEPFFLNSRTYQIKKREENLLWQKTNQKPHCVYFNHWADEQTQQDADTMHRSRKVIFFSSQTCVERMGERCKYCHQVYFYQFFFFFNGTWSWLDWGGNGPACSWRFVFSRWVVQILSKHSFRALHSVFKNFQQAKKLRLKLHLFSAPLPLPSTPISLSWLTGHQKSSLCLSLNTLPASLFPVPSHPLCQMQWDWMQLWLNAAI